MILFTTVPRRFPEALKRGLRGAFLGGLLLIGLLGSSRKARGQHNHTQDRAHSSAVAGSGSAASYSIEAEGAVIRGDTSSGAPKRLALVFTGDEFAEGGRLVRNTLKKEQIPASFFLTGRFYSNPALAPLIRQLKKDGDYLGPHSDQHLLYCDWTKRDSLLVTKANFRKDLEANYRKMAGFGISKKDAPYFLPAYEWYNDSIARWTGEMGLTLVNYTPGTISTADYTWPEMGRKYRGSEEVYRSIMEYEARYPNGLKGFILLVHLGTDPRRTDKFYKRLDELVNELKARGYRFVRIDRLLPRARI